MARKDLSENQKIVQDDILRYKTNKLASMLAILGIVFNCLYFTYLYGLNDNYFYNIEIGFSIIITLAVLLSVFLASEGVKNYNKTYCIVLLVVAAVQIIRMIIMPIMAVTGSSLFAPERYQNANVLAGHYFEIEFSPVASCILLVIYLAASAGCLIASAVFGYLYAKRLEAFNAKIESGEISIEKSLAELEKEEVAKAEQAEVAHVQEEAPAVAEPEAAETESAEAPVEEASTTEEAPKEDASSEEVQ